MARPKKKPEIWSFLCMKGGKPICVSKMLYYGPGNGEIIERKQLISDEEMDAYKKKIGERISEVASGLPGFQQGYSVQHRDGESAAGRP